VNNATITHSTQFNSRPAWFKTVNKLWKLSYPIGGEIKLDKDDFIRKARKKTGIDDLGKDFNDEPLEHLLKSIREEAALHPIGAFITRERMINLITVRLRAEWWFKKHPEILEQEMYPVWMIMGLQRTGTTKLQRLLCADPDNRVLRSWEAINPAPLNGEAFHEYEKRLKKAKTAEKALKLMAPGFFAIHPVEAQAPEEDILLLDVSFLSTTPEATMHVPSYAAWLEKTDQSEAYIYAAKLFKLLQWQHPGRRWILKSPHHLEFLDLAQKHLGDIRFIWTHRKLTECIPSFLSMVGHSRVIFSDNVELETVAKHWLRKIHFMLSRGVEYRLQGINKERFIDIYYEDFIKDPMKDILRVYDQFDKADHSLLPNFVDADQKNPKGKYGVHQYSYADFGLTEEDILKPAESYINRYYSKT
jgi:hypothetical protein